MALVAGFACTSSAQQVNRSRALAAYREVVWQLMPWERRNVEYLNYREGYMVSPHGIFPIAKERLPEGLPLPEGGADVAIAPFRRVKSNPGYSFVQGSVTLPTVLTGVNQAGEAAYNYFGIQRSNSDVEAGLVSSTLNIAGRWYIFYHLGDIWGPSPAWPTGGMAPGTPVFMQLCILPPSRVSFYVSYTDPDPSFSFQLPQEKTVVIEAEGFDPGGNNQRVRRVTSLLLNTVSGSSKVNSWSQVKLGTSVFLHALWTPLDTEEALSSPPAYVTANEISKYWTESVEIEAP
ncbi:MAG: hypothetical protein M3R13_09535 [Armatimonadota bacterium]|nr:hypothetical protein [Armatimonadota bacterium]